ncbi:MAG TPA: hypothetical protein VHN98_04885 [Acidimicrobiales bacterium]|nr:hypothetical protein [Acidimicrobiales bacterium]
MDRETATLPPPSRRGVAEAQALHDAARVAADLPIRGCLARQPTERELLAQHLYERLHPAMAALGAIFLVVVLGQVAARPGTALQQTLVATTWLVWLAFAVEYGLRAVIAPSTARFLRRTWWQLVFLAFPFLSMLRVLLFLRLARPTRVVLAAFRSSRSAARTLTSRLTWLGALTVIVMFTTADLVYEFGDIHPYGRALHAAAKATIAAEAMPGDRGIVQVLDVVVGIFSIAVFGALAGTFGAYFLEHRGEQHALRESIERA